MEMKNKKEKVEKIQRVLKYENGINIEPVGLAGGSSLWWNGD